MTTSKDQTRSVQLKWLKQKNSVPAGVAWGVPWLEGELNRDEALALRDASGKQVPVQSWVSAYWPDGSVKWSAHAAALSPEDQDGYFMSKGDPSFPDQALAIIEKEESIEVNTGSMTCLINRNGSSFIRSIIQGTDRLLCTEGKLICIREEQTEASGSRTFKEDTFESEILKTVIEQSGPVRGVIRIEGRHKQTAGNRAWLPFKLRLYFYYGMNSFKIVHTFIYDGNPHKDFIKGIGMVFKMPMQGPLYNRHLRMSGDTGFFRESPKNLATIRTTGKYKELYQQQFNGKNVEFEKEEDKRFIDLLDESAVWDSFKLIQDSAEHYKIEKRTKEGCSWLKAAEGNRSKGLLYAGSENGGLAIGLQNFWQKHPASSELQHMSKESAELKVWFWSPESKPMDLRHYDTETHLESSYEGFEEMRSTPYGIANTNELQISCFEQTPDHELLNQIAEENQHPSHLFCEPSYYHHTKAFGVWSLSDESTPAKAWFEDQLDAVTQFYMDEIEQRKWYGFWDYGDVMHSYDPIRHTWRYDIGGCAWQNTELAPNMWLWFMFLRTGRADIFRMAEAMTRHNSEVDVYHIGEYAGLGSRHNVIHWGCGCKEARIGMAGLHRFYYYLTADERIGDIMDEVKDSDFTTQTLDPMRSYLPKDEFPTHVRVGPDWAAFSSNWMTRWERFEDTEYRDKLMTGINYLKKLPYRLLTGPIFGYDPKNGQLSHMGDDNWGRHLAICMGAPQVWMELAQILKDSEWEEMIAEMGEFYNLSKEEKVQRTQGSIKGENGSWNHPVFSTGIVAYAAVKQNKPELAELAWKILLEECELGAHPLSQEIKTVDDQQYIKPLQEIPWMSTNTAAQWALNTIVCLELIGDALPLDLQK